jgi:hypothetical protein
MKQTFYDIHYHLFDLSHPNLLAFLLRDDLITKETVRKIHRKLPFYLNFLPIGAAACFPGKIADKVRDYLKNDAVNFRNLLAVMENTIEYHFLYVEYFLKNGEKYFGNDAEDQFSKVAICPLLIDFGYKNLNNNDCFYNLPPGKPVAKQVLDLINAEYFYYRYDLIPHPEKSGRLKIIESVNSKEKKLFEIYPFLGINTRNYDLLEIKALFDKYFTGYEDDKDPEIRKKKLFNKLGKVRVDFEDLIFHKKEKEDPGFYAYIFTGIKLYPPMGFDPWPENDLHELEKVKFLYSECSRKKIPLTVHCSDGGFITSPDSQYLTDPSEGWRKVLMNSAYKDLRINFSHMGNQSGQAHKWLDTIIGYIRKNRNVFTDCSCITPDEKDYELVSEIFDDDTKNNILFGTDFVINLIWSHSYNDYLYNFIGTSYLDSGQKKLMSEANPEKFLFGPPAGPREFL